MRFTKLLVSGLSLIALAAVPAMADITYTLNVDNCTGGCSPPNPMGTVLLHDNALGSVTVTVTLNPPLEFVNTGLQETIDFNIAGTPTIGFSSSSNPNFSLTSTTANGCGGPCHFDGFGDFTYAVELNTAQGAGGAQASPETFTITASNLTSASFIQNAGGWFFGVDVYNPTRNTTGPIGTGSNGTLSGQGSTPEPTSVLLLGTAFGLVLMVMRRRLGKQSQAL